MMSDDFCLVEGGALPEEMGLELHLGGFRMLGARESGGVGGRVGIESRSAGIRMAWFPVLAHP